MNKETYALVTKLIAVVSSCRTRAQVKTARRYVALACRHQPELNHDFYLKALNRIDSQLLADKRPRLILSRPAHKMTTITIEDDNDVDQ